MAALICVVHVNVISGHAVFTNVAYSKPATLSSNFPNGSFPGSNAVNGLLSDLAHTSLEKSPWLRIDLGARFLIHEIEVFARSDHLGKHQDIYCHKTFNGKVTYIECFEYYEVILLVGA